MIQAPSKPPTMISVVQTVYFHPTAGGGDTEQFDNRYSQILAQDEQPYVRVLQCNENWTKLECGWIEPDKCSCLILEHGTKTSLGQAIQPSSGVIEIGVFTGLTEITPIMNLSPGTSLRFPPVDLNKFMVRCRDGSARCKLILFPI